MSARAKKEDATHRLEDMTTQEVSLVDRAANLRTFLTLKSEDKDNMTTKQALVLPTEAKDTLIEGVADALEKLTGVTQAIKESTVEDSAEVPQELPRMIMEASNLLSKVAQKFLTDEGTSEGDSDSADSDASTEKLRGFLEKARRMTGSRENKLKELASMLREFGAEFGIDLTEQAAEVEGETADSETEKNDKATLDVVSGLVSAVSALSEKVDAIGKASDEKTNKTINELSDQVKTLKASIEAPGESNSHGAEGDTPPPKDKFTWPTDFAAHVAQKRAANG